MPNLLEVKTPRVRSVLARSGPFLVWREEAIFHCYPKLYTQTHAEKSISPRLQGMTINLELKAQTVRIVIYYLRGFRGWKDLIGGFDYWMDPT